MLTQARLKEVLYYEPSTGVFTWCNNQRKAGCKKDRGGYRVIKIDRRRYYEHRLAWLYMIGSYPREVDHHDLDKSNNVWSNLRSADKSKNGANRTLRVDNTSGYKGVSQDRTRWSAYVTCKGKRTFIGGFATKEEAARAYQAKAIQLFGAFARP